MANSAFSVVGLAHKVMLAGETQGHTPETFNRLAEHPTLLRDILKVLEGSAQIVPTEMAVKPFVQMVQSTLTVLPNLTFTERIALGKYDWTNPDITSERFPHNPATVGEWELDLFWPNCKISSEEAKKRVEVDGWVVAEWEHELAFGAAFPDEQRKYPVVALGSVCSVRGDRYVLVLWRDGLVERGVRLCHVGGVWDPRYRFLRVRKVQRSVA